MTHGRRQLTAILVLAALSLGAGGEEAPPFRVIVNPTNVCESIRRDELSKMFLRKVLAWRWGEATLPVEQRDGSLLREAFTTWVHRRSVQAVSFYWQQQVFSGRGAPPPERQSDAAVMEYVAENPGAVGYVTLSAKLNGVKVIQVTE
jgi:ABC-type phosphate transport system substrate-binding protein